MWKIEHRRRISYRWRIIDFARDCEEAEEKVRQLSKILKGDFRILKLIVNTVARQEGHEGNYNRR